MMKGGMGNMMKQAQMMQANMQKAQAELAETLVEGSASNGLVKISMTCNNDVKRVQIDDAANGSCFCDECRHVNSSIATL